MTARTPPERAADKLRSDVAAGCQDSVVQDRPSIPAPVSGVSVSSVSYRYPGADEEALGQVTFEVAPGQVVAVLGPNGSGKSTLFRILSTALCPAAGQAKIDGRDVTQETAEIRRSLGVVFQQPSLDVKLTAEENLIHQGRLYGISGTDLRGLVRTALERAGLTDRKDDRVERFSGGMRRRLELAKAVLHGPRVLILDEPTVGLDPSARREFLEQLEHLRSSQGVTVLLTTHLMDEADWCDRVVVLSCGKLIADDRPEALKCRIGGDVVLIEPIEGQTQSIHKEVTERFGPWPTGRAPRVVGRSIRLERADGADFVGSITSAFAGRIGRVSVGRPTLEDVFLNLTGRGFEDQSVKVED